MSRAVVGHMRIYRGFMVEKQFPSGMWAASNYGDGYPFLRADSLDGIKRIVRLAIMERERAQ